MARRNRSIRDLPSVLSPVDVLAEMGDPGNAMDGLNYDLRRVAHGGLPVLNARAIACDGVKLDPVSGRVDVHRDALHMLESFDDDLGDDFDYE